MNFVWKLRSQEFCISIPMYTWYMPYGILLNKYFYQNSEMQIIILAGSSTTQCFIYIFSQRKRRRRSLRRKEAHRPHCTPEQLNSF